MKYALFFTALTLMSGVALADETPPLWSQADQYYDPAEMAATRAAVLKRNGGAAHWFIMADRMEVQIADDETGLVWDASAWYGTDENKLWIKTEGELSDGDFGEAEIQALWSRPISTYFDVQAGARYDFSPGGQTYLTAGVQGLAPYWFEVDAAVFLSADGDLSARIEAEYDMRLTQNIIFQPRTEVELSAQSVDALGVGSGLTSLEAGVRLRYEISPQVAPYIGAEWSGSFGQTKGRARLRGEDTSGVSLLAGLRVWY